MCRTPAGPHAMFGLSIQSECVSGAPRMNFCAAGVEVGAVRASAAAAGAIAPTAAAFTNERRVIMPVATELSRISLPANGAKHLTRRAAARSFPLHLPYLN